MYLSAITCASDLRRCELSTGGRPFTSRRQSSITQGATRLPPEGHRAATRSRQRRVGEKKTNTPPRSKKSAGRQTRLIVIGLVLWSSRCRHAVRVKGDDGGEETGARGAERRQRRGRGGRRRCATTDHHPALGLPRWRQTSRCNASTRRPVRPRVRSTFNHRHDVGLLARTCMKRRSPPPPTTPPSEMKCDRVFVVR